MIPRAMLTCHQASARLGDESSLLASYHRTLAVQMRNQMILGDESSLLASYHVYSGTECEVRSIMHALVTKALSLSYHIYSLRSALRLRLSAAKAAW